MYPLYHPANRILGFANKEYAEGKMLTRIQEAELDVQGLLCGCRSRFCQPCMVHQALQRAKKEAANAAR